VAAGALEFAEGSAHERGGAWRVVGCVFEVDCQLLVGFETFARISKDAFPELAGQWEVALAFGEAGERAAGGAIGFGR
jgi:hypothetical protein